MPADERYTPKPIDTRRVHAPPGMNELIGELAEHVHDVWAERRLVQGWTHGPERSDARLEHPDLIPYEKLPETEKQYDRASVEQVLRGALALGWRLEPPAPAGPPGGRLAPRATSALRAIRDLEPPADPRHARDFYVALGDAILKQGEPLLAYDVLCEGLEADPDDLRLRQLQALALARSGAAERSADLLLELFGGGHQDGETLGLLAGRQKELAARAREPHQRDAQLRAARRTYELAYRLAAREDRPGEASYTGINAATLALLEGDADAARAIAREVRELCLVQQEHGASDPYWIEATLGESALILGEPSAALEHYARAARLGARRYADLCSTLTQARALLSHLAIDSEAIEACLRLPRIVVFTRAPRTLPEERAFHESPPDEPALAGELDRRLEELDAGFGYASPRGPDDILFLEAMARRGAELQIVLPVTPEAFRRSRFRSPSTREWRRRFDVLLERAAALRVVNPANAVESAVALEYAELVLDGIARLRGRMLHAPVTPLVLERGSSADGTRDACALLRLWRERERSLEVIEAAVPEPAPPSAPEAAAASPGSGGGKASEQPPQRIMAMIFADVPGFSRLREHQIPCFIRVFMGSVAELIRGAPHPPATRNTWGDGLYLVFESVADALRFALDLRDRIAAADWAAHGLPGRLSLRIALHAGPVIPCVDPVIEQPSFAGAHVSQTARIEPITPPGEVYASEGFAALAQVADVEGIAWEYVGQTSFAKGYGTHPLYHVRRV